MIDVFGIRYEAWTTATTSCPRVGRKSSYGGQLRRDAYIVWWVVIRVTEDMPRSSQLIPICGDTSSYLERSIKYASRSRKPAIRAETERVYSTY